MSGADRFWERSFLYFGAFHVPPFYPDTLYFLLNTLAHSSLAPGNIFSLASPETCGLLKSLSLLMETLAGEIFPVSPKRSGRNASADTIIYGQWLWAAGNTPGDQAGQGFRYTKRSQADVTSDFAIWGTNLKMSSRAMCVLSSRWSL